MTEKQIEKSIKKKHVSLTLKETFIYYRWTIWCSIITTCMIMGIIVFAKGFAFEILILYAPAVIDFLWNYHDLKLKPLKYDITREDLDRLIEELKWDIKINDKTHKAITIIQGSSTEERIVIIFDKKILISRFIFRHANLPFWVLDNNFRICLKMA